MPGCCEGLRVNPGIRAMRFARVFGPLATLLFPIGVAATQQPPNDKTHATSIAAAMDPINQRLRALVANGPPDLPRFAFATSTDSADRARAKKLAESPRDLRIVVS